MPNIRSRLVESPSWLLAIAGLALILCGSLFLASGASRADPRADCPHPSSPFFYYAAGALDADRSDLDEFVRDWYSKHLRTMEEPSLSCGSARAEETYRFLWLRTFHHPIVVRVEFSSNAAKLSAIELSGAGGYDPGAVPKRTRRTLSAEEAARLRAALERGAFWQMPNRIKRWGFDGSEWVIEGRRDASHRIVERWKPEDGAFKDLGLLFLELARFRSTGPTVY